LPGVLNSSPFAELPMRIVEHTINYEDGSPIFGTVFNLSLRPLEAHGPSGSLIT
jgi:hypothetical protein